ncbi:MAG TPA: DUF5915 domain-containing protein, partial [Cellulomonadaceae bacterium]|nr:DUF5915 domain-containing protein [Cellulomonadaceae bacterium]
DAFDTLWTALEALTRVMAPLAPLVTEEIWRGLTGARSVHLTDWPAIGTGGPDAVLAGDHELVAAMDRVREIVSVALGLRKANGLRVRQPLRALSVATDDPAAVEPYRALVAAELNVKSVELVALADGAAERFGVTSRLAVNARAVGPRLGKRVQDVIRAAKAGEWSATPQGGVVVRTADGEVTLHEGEFELTTVIDGAGTEVGRDVAAAVLGDSGFVVLDLVLDEALRAEGLARDAVRVVQDSRKAADLHVSDRIRLRLVVPGDWVAAMEEHRGLIARETLADDVAVIGSDVDAPAAQVERVLS